MAEPMVYVTDGELKKTLEELYRNYFRQARGFANEADQESAYYEAKAHGGTEAIGAIYLWLYGGEEMNKLWMSEVNRSDKTAGN